MELETSDLIDPILEQIEKECDNLKEFIKSGDFPYYKSHSFNKIVNHASAILLLAGEIKAIHSLQEHNITESVCSYSKDELIKRLLDCNID